VTRCQCGEWSGVRCATQGSVSAFAKVEFMPEHLRASHEAAHNRGSYPHNGARRILVSAECAAEMIEHDGAWVTQEEI
jgi:hypothetical protein